MKLLLKIFVGILLAPFVLWIFANIGLNIWFQGMRMWNYWTVPESLYVEEGDRFVVVEAFEIGGLTHYNAPFTGGFDAQVPAGTVLRAFGDSVPGASAFGCVPENTEEFEQQFVPADDRLSPKYDAYSLVVPLKEIGKRIQRLEAEE